MSNQYPRNFARFYDLIYHSQRDGVDNEYFLNEIRKTNGKILEVGAGTGRLFINALDTGADIYGLDLSPAMLDVLLGKLDKDQHHRISLQNIIDFSFNFKFDLIIAPFRVFMHLLNKEEQIKALNNVYKHLSKNGRFIFDVFVPDLNQLLNGLKDIEDFEGDFEPGKKVRRVVSTKPDLINQVIEVTFRLEWEEDGGKQTDEWVVPLRFFFRYELEHLIERSKFPEYQIVGDYQGNQLNSRSKEFIMICKKN